MAILILVACNSKQKEVIGDNEFYVCSMDPQVMEKQMGMCPICKMPLAKVTIDKTQLHLIKLNEEQVKLGNIKTDTVRMDSIWEEKTLTGVFTINQNLQQQISSRFNGRIEKLYFKIPGQEIRQGDLIYEVYSRDLMLAQEEYIFSLERSGMFSGDDGLIESAKNKLLLWGLTEEQIKKLEEEKKANITNPIYSKVSGVIMEIPFREGDYIDEGSAIFKLADLSNLWVEAQVYSNELNQIGLNNKLLVIPEAYPEEQIVGEIDFSNPELQIGSKINLIRVKIPNSRRQFIPGMMAFVVLRSKPKPAITLPPGSVIRVGNKAHAWIRNKDGSFEARQVFTGMQTGTKIEILDGLKAGETVVTSGAYLLYSDYVFKRGAYPLEIGSNSKINGADHH